MVSKHAAWAVALFPLTLAYAQPQIAVKARAYVDDVRAFARGRDVTVTGALRDDRGQAVPGERVRVADTTVVTGADGRFTTSFVIQTEGRRTLEVRFPGGTLLGAATAQVEVVVGRTEVKIELSVGAEVDAARPVHVDIHVVDAGGADVAGAELRMRLNGADLGRDVTDQAGKALLPLVDLTPGLHLLEVTWPGDNQRLGARAEARIEATHPLRVELAAPQTAPVPGDPIVLEGRVLGGDDPEVVLTANGRPAERLRTRAGRFRAVLDPDDLPTGEVTFRATAHTSTPGWRDGASEDVTVHVPVPPPPSPWWVWAPALLALVSLAGVAIRRMPRPDVTRTERLAPPSLPPFVFEEAAPESGLVVTVVCAVQGHPVRAIVVRMEPAAHTPHPAGTDPPLGHKVETGRDGRAELPAGGERVWVWAPGYAPACHALPAAVGRAQVRLVPLRARLQTLYAEVLRAAGRPRLRFGRETPREARGPLLNRGAPADPLVRLTALVERACYGPQAPAPSELREALALADEVRSGLRRVTS